jgi:hypothetical protein
MFIALHHSIFAARVVTLVTLQSLAGTAVADLAAKAWRAPMQLSHLTGLVLGISLIAGSIAVMTEIVRQSAVVPYLAIVAGLFGTLFFWSVRIFTLPGVALSLLAILLGAMSAVARRRAAKKQQRSARRLLVLSDSGVWRLHAEAYLSDSGHWRLRV